MRKILKNKKILVLVMLTFGIFLAPFAFSADFEIEFPAVGPDDTTPDKGGGPIVWVNYIFLFGVTISGIAAVGSLIYAGILWITSESTGKIQEARARIWAAILGVLIVAGSVVILRTINPDLVNLKQPDVKNSIFYQTYQYSELCKFDEYYDLITEECRARSQDGDECVLNIQCVSNNCVEGECGTSILEDCAPINTQSTCPTDQWCGPTATCINKGADASSSCTLDVHCRSGECDLNTNTCKKGRGENCKITVTNDCAQGFVCEVNGLGVNGTCQ